MGAVAAEPVVDVLTGRGSSVYYALGVALASNIARTLPQAKISVVGSRGSIENLERLQGGRGEIAFALGDALVDAWKGNPEAGFKAPLRKLRGIAGLYPDYIQIMARADAGIATLSDLRGKRVSVGIRGSAVELNARAILAAAGLSYESFATVEYRPFGESVEWMKDRKLDATLQSAALGAMALRDLASAVDIVLVPVPAETVRKIDNAAYLAGVVPANAYRGQTENVPVAAVQNYLVTRDDLPADTVYAITKALWTGLDQLVAAHPAARMIERKRALEGMPVPLHPGAEKYYRETKQIR